jgi:gamma-glutamylcyclotransferase (GGCT)/AIG2-like uncharacterized protein YtfP
MDEPTAFFVYGTLKRGQLNCSLIEPHARWIERAYTSGRLFDVGLFPALVEGEGTVHGELVHLDAMDVPRLLSLIDRLEDFRPEDPGGSMYVRRVVEVTTDSNHRVPAYAYFYNCEHPSLPRPATLVHLAAGEWPAAEEPAIEGSPALRAFQQHVRTYRETALAKSDSDYE